MQSWRRVGGPLRTTALGLACVLLGSTVAALGPAAGPAAAAGGPRGTLRWQRCGGGLECTRLDVPVDPRVPDGEPVSLSLIRAPARDRSRRIGSLVVNYGGPGDAGTQTLPHALADIPAEIRDRFDVVSFDPRGTGGSRALDCIDDAASDTLASDDPTPDDPAELLRSYTGESSSVDVVGACVARFGSWLAAVGTRNVARDLDRIRIALGEERLDFLGYSYGTVLGAVYAQEFPDHVRTMVLDGAVDLSATPAEEQAATAAGFEHALDRFLTWCAATRSCPLRAGGDPRTALGHLRDQFEQGLTVPVRDGRRAGVASFYVAMLASLYDREQGWPALAAALQGADDGDGTGLQALADAFLGRDANGHHDVLQEAIGPIRCADRPTPVPPFTEYRAAFDDAVRRYPFLGPLLGSIQTGCDPRLPAPDPADVLGDVTAAPDAPVLVIGTTEDPATPYSGAIDLQRRITGSRLLTFASTEHSAYGRGVACIDDAVDRYLITRKLPPVGRRCRT